MFPDKNSGQSISSEQKRWFSPAGKTEQGEIKMERYENNSTYPRHRLITHPRNCAVTNFSEYSQPKEEMYHARPRFTY